MKKKDYRPKSSLFEDEPAFNDYLASLGKPYKEKLDSSPFEGEMTECNISWKKHRWYNSFVEILRSVRSRIKEKLLLGKNKWKMRRNRFSIINDEGKHVKCKILFTFDSAATGKSYVAFTDDTKDEDGNTNVYSAVYDPEGPKKQMLASIEDPQELKHVESVMNDLVEILRDGRDHPEYFV